MSKHSQSDAARKMMFSPAAVIENNPPSYLGDGNNLVDKTVEKTYTNQNQTLIVESHFDGAETVCNLLKRFLLEQASSRTKVAKAMFPQYNDSGNTVVAASTKEDSV